MIKKEVLLKVPWIQYLERRRQCQRELDNYTRTCKRPAYWSYMDGTFCWHHLNSELYQFDLNIWAWLRVRRFKTVHIDMAAYNRNQADIRICWADMTGTHGLNGDMSTNWFEKEAEEAWERLTPRQQEWLMTKAVNYFAGRASTG